jgi:hypothetical protein
MAPVLVSLGRIVHVIEKNPHHDTTPGSSEVVARAALVTVVHPDPNPEERVDLTVFGPGGPVVVTDIPHVEPEAAEPETAKAKKAQAAAHEPAPPPVLVGTPGTWRWPAVVTAPPAPVAIDGE